MPRQAVCGNLPRRRDARKIGIYFCFGTPCPDDLLKKQQINPWFLNGKYPEIPLMAREILLRREEIEGNSSQPINQTTDTKSGISVITLQQVFKTIEKDSFPFLWNVMIKTISFMPTSASCEQSFSCLKHRLHENMKKTTAINFLLSSHDNSVFALYNGFKPRKEGPGELSKHKPDLTKVS